MDRIGLEYLNLKLTILKAKLKILKLSENKKLVKVFCLIFYSFFKVTTRCG
jgi:hypothetical protein